MFLIAFGNMTAEKLPHGEIASRMWQTIVEFLVFSDSVKRHNTAFVYRL
jgi:hypothetical protein